jgi:hypothetical protein
MADKIAGIDVHKKVLMVVVMDARTPESKPERRRFATMPSELRRLSTWLQEQGVEEAVMESTAAVLAIGVAGVGAAYVLAPGAGIFQPCSARAQA